MYCTYEVYVSGDMLSCQDEKRPGTWDGRTGRRRLSLWWDMGVGLPLSPFITI